MKRNSGDVTSGKAVPVASGPKIVSGVHWAPDSDHVMVNEEYGSKYQARPCPENTRFVIYQISNQQRREIANPCGLRDWYFGWISDPARWIRSLSAP